MTHYGIDFFSFVLANPIGVIMLKRRLLRKRSGSSTANEVQQCAEPLFNADRPQCVFERPKLPTKYAFGKGVEMQGAFCR